MIVGLRDDGTCARLPITDTLLRNLADMRSDGNILPFPLMTVQKRVVAGCEVAAVIVAPSSAPPVRLRGRVFIRVGPRRGVATQEEERRLSERSRARNLPFDLQPVATGHVVVPLSPDLFSLQGLRNLGPTLRRWREEWRDRRGRNPAPEKLALPDGAMEPAGYVVHQHAVRLDRPVRAYQKWARRIPQVYRESVLNQPVENAPAMDRDPQCLAALKHYRSLMPMAQEARKPMFYLKPADGALGAHQAAVSAVNKDFKELAEAIARRTGIRPP